jgi:hypothetical protein
VPDDDEDREEDDAGAQEEDRFGPDQTGLLTGRLTGTGRLQLMLGELDEPFVNRGRSQGHKRG